MAHSQWCRTLFDLLHSGRSSGELLYSPNLTLLQRRIWGDRGSLDGCVEYRSQSWYLAGLLRGHGLCGSGHWPHRR